MEAGASAGASREQQMQAQVAKIKEITGVDLPSYYNPSAINPLQYAEQIKKRKMLWSKGKDLGDQDPASSGGQPGPKPLMQGLVPQASPSVSSLSATAQPRGLALLGKPKNLGFTPASASKESASSAQSSGPAPTQPVKTSFNKWESTNLGDNQANEKFRRLMGIKGGGGAPPPASASSGGSSSSSAAISSSSTQKMFDDQEAQYERARQITHRNRGLGLGFTSQPQNTPEQEEAQRKAANCPPGQNWVKLDSGGIQFVRKQ